MEVNKDIIAAINMEIQKANRLRYEVNMQFINCQQLREVVYGYIKKYRSYLCSCCPKITPVNIVKNENTFEPLSLLIPNEGTKWREQEVSKYEEYIEAIKSHEALVNCFYTCLIEVKRTYHEILAAWELISSYFESIGISVNYREGKNTAFLEEMQVQYTPGVCGRGGHTEQRFEKCIAHIMQCKMLSDELLYAPLLQKNPEENSKYDRIELLRILNRLLDERRKLEAETILPVEEPTEKINPALFTKDTLYDEFVCTWEED